MRAGASFAALLSCSLTSQPLPSVSRCTRLVAQAAATKVVWSDLTEDAQRLTDAQACRTIAAVCAEGVLCSRTSMPGAEGAAFVNHAPYVLDAQGCPVMPLSSQEAISNLDKDVAASFYARAPRGGAAAGSAITLIGTVEEVSIDDIDDMQLKTISDVMGTSLETVATLAWRRFVPASVHLQDAVRGVEAWVALSEYASAEPNPLAPSAVSLLAKINRQHGPALQRFAGVYAGVPPENVQEAELLGVDQLGFDLCVTLGPSAPSTVMRIGFKMPPASEEEGISVFMKLFQEAYERQHGFMQ